MEVGLITCDLFFPRGNCFHLFSAAVLCPSSKTIMPPFAILVDFVGARYAFVALAHQLHGLNFKLVEQQSF